ncbi:MAG: phosphatase PAP2 family protein [Ignavibacteriaceae bacterium]|nr:phosphatase PAP2 family protein [Ignavibacteriaceae bacterium]MCU0413634.1 phosphatase PAP2 family protein [Ignavibacteriaceae bacterium]
MDFLYSIDLAVFYFFNHTISTGFLDKFFSIITDVNKWYIAYVILICIAFFKGGRRGKIAVIGLIFLIIVTDQTGYRLLKETIERIRPCYTLSDAITPIGCAGGFSFPSNHALNNFAAAVFLLSLFPAYKWIFLVVATLVSLSRIYLGVHYPSDVIGGALIGGAFGYLFSIAALKLEKYFMKRNELTHK